MGRNKYVDNNKREYAFPQAIKNLNEIRTPTLVITAEYDLEICKRVAALLGKEIPDARLISIPDAGHIMNMDNPKEFNKVIAKFVDQVKP